MPGFLCLAGQESQGLLRAPQEPRKPATRRLIPTVPERTVRDKWREWELPAYRIGKHLRWKERDVHAWIDRQAA